MSLINNTGKFKDKSKKKRKLNTKKLQYGTLSIVLTVVFIAVIVLVNAGASFLNEHPENIKFILFTLIVLKLERFNSFNDEQ